MEAKTINTGGVGSIEVRPPIPPKNITLEVQDAEVILFMTFGDTEPQSNKEE
jgi:hypothetical protein